MKIPFTNRKPTVAVIRLQGLIGSSARPGASALSDAGLRPLLERAFKRRKPVALALVINSPGGSPVQSSLIGARIRRLSETHKVPVHAFVEDVAASGGYWLACAADKIWADESSVLGSIGVISAGFGFHELIERWGIQRRVHTAGQSKSQLDPFRPENPEDIARLDELLQSIHHSFKQHVIARRGSLLPEDKDLFTGEFWAGQRAVELGLADGIGHLEPKMRALYGDVRFERYGIRQPWFRRIGLSGEALLGAVDERTAFARFGVGG